MQLNGRKKVCVFWGMLVISVGVLLQAADMDTFFTTNILAVVTGYQTERTLPSGITVPMFSITPEAGNGEEKGILFYVVAPTNLAGHFFWMHHDGLAASGKSFVNYNPDALYSFQYNFEIVEGAHASVWPSDLFKIAVSGQSLCSLRPPGYRLFSSTTEILKELEEIDSSLKQKQREIAIRQEMLTVLPPESRLYKREELGIKYLTEQIEKAFPEQKNKMLNSLQAAPANAEYLKPLKQLKPPPEGGHSND